MAAENKESAMQALRMDLSWDAKILDLFQACEFSNHAWWALEPEELQIGPQSHLVVEPGLFGTHKLYNTFSILSPGPVLIDGFHQNEHQVPAKVKMAFTPYWSLKLTQPSCSLRSRLSSLPTDIGFRLSQSTTVRFST